MGKYIKSLMIKDLEKKFEGVSEFLVVSTTGIGGNENNEMRGALLDKGVRISIVKNAMMQKALDAMDMGEAAELFDAGPCAVAYGGDSVVDVAKEISDWAKKLKPVYIKGAYVDGDVLGEDDAKELAKMPNRAELQGRVVLMAKSPGSNIAGILAGPASVIAGCIEAIVEKSDKGE